MKLSKYDWAIIVSYLGYTTYWSYLTIVKFVNLNATILDLGSNMQIAWDVISKPSSYFSVVPASHGSLLPWVLIFLPRSFFFALAFQSAWLGLGAIPLFWAARRKLGDPRVALLLALLYLVYFPLAGPNWFDFHVETLFPTFFIFGYYSYSKGSHYLAALFFCLAASIRFPFTVFPLLFSAIELVILGFSRKSGSSKKVMLPYLIILVYSGLVSTYFIALVAHGSLSSLFGQYAYINLPAAKSGASGGSGGYAAFAGNYNPVVASETFLLFFLPLAFLPLLSPRWWPFYSPYLVLLFNSGYYGFYYPYVFELQYTVILAPFVFLAALDAIPKIKGLLLGEGRSPLRELSRNSAPALPPSRVAGRRAAYAGLIVLMVILSAISAIYFEPYGPLNGTTAQPFNATLEPDLRQYSELEQLIALIPKGSVVLTQNNLPQVYPVQAHGIREVIDSAFWKYTQPIPNLSAINAILADPWNPWFGAGGGTLPDYSVSSALQLLLDNGTFGILGEAEGIILAVRGYCGSPVYYAPVNLTVAIDGSGSYSLPLLPPGEYLASYYGSLPSSYAGSNITLAASSPLGLPLAAFRSYPLNATDLGVSHQFMLSFNVTGFSETVSFSAYVGALNIFPQLSKLSIMQLSPSSGCAG